MAVEKTIKLRVDTGDSAKKVKEVDDGIKDTGKSARGAKGGFIGLTGGVGKLGAGASYPILNTPLVEEEHPLPVYPLPPVASPKSIASPVDAIVI